jgi:hypothetical protein
MSKLKIRSNYNPPVDKGVINEEKEITMPGLEDNPRQVLENHVRGINPITGAILDKQMYYGDAIVPYNKDLTFEELRIKAAALKNQLQDAESKMAALQQTAGESSNDGTSVPSTESKGEGES